VLFKQKVGLLYFIMDYCQYEHKSMRFQKILPKQTETQRSFNFHQWIEGLTGSPCSACEYYDIKMMPSQVHNCI